MDKKTLRAVRKIVGKKNLLTDLEDLVCYSYDGTKQQCLPEAVVKPSCATHVAQLLALASDNGVPVYARGAGTGLSGGAVPVNGGLVVDFGRMDSVLEIDTQNLVAVVEPGVVTGQLQTQVQALGLLYPPDPASADSSTIGGNVAENAGGLRGLKYGVTKHYVLGLEVALADGTVIHTGSQTYKNVTGYDLTQFFVGSEGTLGLFTKIVLKLVPLPEEIRTLIAFFDSATDASDASAAIVEARILPRALEFMDSSCIECVRQYQDTGVPPRAQALLLVEIDGPAESVERDLLKVSGVVAAHQAFDVRTAKELPDRDRLWLTRRSVSPALFRLASVKYNEDVCVPRSRVTELFTWIDEQRPLTPLPVLCFGHIGDGNIHVNIMFEEDGRPQADAFAERLMKRVVQLNGTLSGEHGIGNIKSRFLDLEVGKRERELMLSLKRTLDPEGILNPGKIFADSTPNIQQPTPNIQVPAPIAADR